MKYWLVSALGVVVVAIVLGVPALITDLVRQESLEAAARSFEVLYRFTVRDVPEEARRVVAWVPLPMANAYQTLDGFYVDGDWPVEILTEA
ncbi:MAG: hypothetical protein QF662_02780, partial [Phycisphaerae bacterium]|nr:hypothetical protein [Phycisphaerae bacterium]